MHEFSLAEEVISLAGREAEKHSARDISEISIEVGSLSGVEADAFESALRLLATNSILDHAQIKIVKTPGIGRCNSCERDFEMDHRMASCPDCRCFPSSISGGKEFRVISLVIE